MPHSLFRSGSPVEIESLPLLLPDRQQEQSDRMNAYYRFQSKIYDLTRWSFLFGRRQLIGRIPWEPEHPPNILEIGCGTGYNLQLLAKRFPGAYLQGIDVSKDMLGRARNRLRNPEIQGRLFHGAYGKRAHPFLQQPDLIVLSYVLTMVNPQWKKLIRHAWEHLPPGGMIAVTDFHDSRWQAFKRHMAGHHVRMDGHLLPELLSYFSAVVQEVRPAYFGCWRYFTFVGRKEFGPAKGKVAVDPN